MTANGDDEVMKEQELVFLFDVDNTLLDNDRVKAEMTERVHVLLDDEGMKKFWAIYEEVRQELDVVSWPETLARFMEAWPDKTVAYRVANIVNGWAYEEYVYPGTMAALECVTQLGEVGILSDGDTAYQPRKIGRAGLSKIVGYSDVLIFTHKQHHLEDIMRRLPGQHYVLVDDKESILAEAKEHLGDKLTTVWVRQGKYAHDPTRYRKPDPDIVLDEIGELCKLTKEDFLRGKQEA
ncbi:MAG: HAD family hydrolase [Chloroflexia bacterium]